MKIMDDIQLTIAIESMARAADKAGSWAALAAICGCTPGNVSQLKKKGSPLPARFVLPVEAGTGISRHDLRPDLYPRETALVAPMARSIAFHDADEMKECDG
jgi:DNA-binding transcriptional regulator YdaS (Cro superfamily)